ncbi:MAG: NAD(P)-binding protein [Methylotenera sp.]|nr:NAD(P)-binding protein [Methylotenera sp.]
MDKVQTYNTLSMLSLKCAANVFDISTGLVHVSIRDQIVRANLLVRDIVALKQKNPEILIVGAGVAGIAAAIAAANAGVIVTIIETNDEPFSLQAVSKHRFIGPYMYEWPANFHTPQNYPPSGWPRWTSLSARSMNWKSDKPINAVDFANNQRLWLNDTLVKWNPKTKAPQLITSVNSGLAKKLVKSFVIQKSKPFVHRVSGTNWLSKRLVNFSVDPKFIILAASMGNEKFTHGDYEGVSFWKPDRLSLKTQQSIAILGGGDGALQDFLRAATTFDHPLQFIDFLNADHRVLPLINKEHDYLLSLEQNSRLNATWTASNEVFEELDGHCRNVAIELAKNQFVRRRVSQGMRGEINAHTSFIDSVHLFVRENFFGKAYLLNRFLVHLINESIAHSPDAFEGKRVAIVHFGHTIDSNKSLMKNKLGFHCIDVLDNVNGTSIQKSFTDLIVRFGVDSDHAPASKLVGLSKKYKATRVNMARIPMPFYFDN